MRLLYHIVLLSIFRQSVSVHLCNETLRILRDICSLIEHLILTNVLITQYTFLACSVAIMVYICYCRL